MKSIRITGGVVSLVTVVLIATGCSYYSPWKKQIGKTTYDQALTQLGEPQRLKKLPNNDLIACWIHETMEVQVVFNDPSGLAEPYQDGPDQWIWWIVMTFDPSEVLKQVQGYCYRPPCNNALESIPYNPKGDAAQRLLRP